MNLEERKDNTYYDKKGKQILVGDLLKVFHFYKGKRAQYMYHVVVMEDNEDFPVMACKAYYADKPHCRMFVLVERGTRIIRNAEIIGVRDWETKRKRIKI